MLRLCTCGIFCANHVTSAAEETMFPEGIFSAATVANGCLQWPEQPEKQPEQVLSVMSLCTNALQEHLMTGRVPSVEKESGKDTDIIRIYTAVSAIRLF